VGPDAPEIDKLRVFYNHPDFVMANAAELAEARDRLPGPAGREARVVFTAHSLPMTMAQNCAYADQLQETCRLVAEAAGVADWQLAYQSRSGPPRQPWLEPDVCDVLRDLHADGVGAVVISPVGFLSDHIEVLFDLDVEARETADELGMKMERAATVGVHPRFVKMVTELIQERAVDGVERRALGARGPYPDRCPQGCCLRGD
jgi:ferrochelatase